MYFTLETARKYIQHQIDKQQLEYRLDRERNERIAADQQEEYEKQVRMYNIRTSIDAECEVLGRPDIRRIEND